jgi:hypothetical protein
MGDQYNYMSGEDFEIFVCNILKKLNFYDIELTKASGDQGVDILAEKDGIRYAIQCKRYSQPVGNKAIQEVYSGKSYYKCHIGIVVTNNYFTQSARKLAYENGIVLWDKDFIDKYADQFYFNKNFKNYLYLSDEITVINDGYKSKILYDYFYKYSIKMINNYIQKGDYNQNIKDIIDNMIGSLSIYNATLYKYEKDYMINYFLYCGLSNNFLNTECYKRIAKIDAEHGENSRYEIATFSIYYLFEKVFLLDQKIITDPATEVSIFVDSFKGMKISEEVDEIRSTYEVLLTENYFPVISKNIL